MLAVIASIQKLEPTAEILFVCSGRGYEIDLLRHANINYKVIPSGKYRRYGRGKFAEILDIKTQIQNIRDLPKILHGYSYSHAIIKHFKPQVVFIKGGYVGLPVGIAATRLGVPLVIHESDAVMGKANKILAKRAVAVAVSFPVATYEAIDDKKIYFTGNPVRSEYSTVDNKAVEGKDKQKPNVLIFAGSQGAQAINRLIFGDLELFLKNFNILHITGEGEVERARFLRHRLPNELKHDYQPYSFLTDGMLSAYRWADLVVARAGMNSLSELAALSKPAIIIPLPGSTNSHQLRNAQILARMGAIRLLRQDELTGVRLLSELTKLASDGLARDYLAKSINKFFKPEAAADIAKLILKQARG